MPHKSALIIFASTLPLLLTTAAWGVSIGQLDDFQDGTTQGWEVAVGPQGGMPPFPPANAAGGAGGAGDLFLQLTSTGGPGAGGRMVVINGAQWTGNYLAAGVTGISMDVANLGGLPLDLRMRFEHFAGPGPPTGDYISSQAVTVGPQSGWQSVFFPIAESDLTDLTGGMGDDYATTLSDVGVIRLMHAPTTMLPPPMIDAVLGVDNVRAVPEPHLAPLSGLLWLALLRRR
ncbi:MAG: hypothetical protein AAGF97_08775 [Planctomycetota bacterium]